MATIKVEVKDEKDLSLLREVFTELGLKFSLDDSDHLYESLSDPAIDGIKDGLRDLENGRIYSHESVKSRLANKISEMRLKYAGN